MEIFSERLRERAKQLGISNAEVARRVGLDERRYAHYVTGRSEPDLKTLTLIARELQTTPDWLLGVARPSDKGEAIAELLGRLLNAASMMAMDQLELFVVQAEAVAIIRQRNQGGDI